MKFWIFVALLLPIIVCAETKVDIPKVSSEFNRLQQQNKQQLEQLQRAAQQRWLNTHQYQQEENQKQVQDLSKVCLPYQSVIFKDFTLIEPQNFAPKKGECLNEQRLNQLSQDLTAAYLAKGYVYNAFHFENDGSGKLIMRVNEGVISKLRSDSRRLNFDTLYPNAVGKPLNIQELDQVLDQANKMAGSNVTVDVYPTENGEIELAFTNKEKAPINGFLAVDNTASKQFNRWQMKSGVNIDNPFGLSDSLYLGLGHSLKFNSRNFSRSATFFYSLPYGYWSFSAFGSFSQFKMQTPLQYTEVQQRGRTWQLGGRADYVFNRGTNHISSLNFQLERQDSKNYFADALLMLQSPKLTSAQIGFNHLQLFEQGSLIVDLSYERGLPWFNALANQGDDQPQGQFNKYALDAQLQYYPRLFDQLIHQSHRVLGQYSRNYLPAAKQADLLGRFAVRGFNDTSISAEQSVILQNNLGLVYNLEHAGKNWWIEPYLLLDLGIQKTSADQQYYQRALGYGAGLKINHPYLSLNIEWGTGRLYHHNEPVWQERSLLFNALWKF